MKKTWTISIAVIVAVVVAAVCLLPRSTWINQTLNAVKLDADGNEIGTVTIHIEGVHLDFLFFPDRLQVSILPFDHLRSVTLSRYNGVKGGTFPDAGGTYIKVWFSAWNLHAGAPCTGEIGFSDDFDCWLIRDYTNSVSYVASVSSEYTTDELKTHFSGKMPTH